MQVMIGVGALAIAALGVTIWILRRQEVFMRQRIAAVEAAEAEVRRLLDELPEAVLLVNADGVVLSTNAAALAMFDLSSPRAGRHPPRRPRQRRRPCAARGRDPACVRGRRRRPAPARDARRQPAHGGDRGLVPPAAPHHRRRRPTAGGAAARRVRARAAVACTRSGSPPLPAGVPVGADRHGARARRRRPHRRRQPVARRDAAARRERARRLHAARVHAPRRRARRAAAPGAPRARHRRLVPHRPALPPPRRRVRVGRAPACRPPRTTA